jgi:hypothetical protein
LERRTVGGLTIWFDASEHEAADLIGRASVRSAELILSEWGLERHANCRVYVLTSWLRFFFHSAPFYLWPPLVLLFPLWAGGVQRIWRVAGGWAQRWPGRRAVGIKPPRLIEAADRTIGSRLFIEGADNEEKVENVTCHELTHAFSSHLRLPMWLNEGLAMVTVDRYFDRQTVQPETLDLLDGWTGRRDPARYRRLRVTDPDTVVYHYARSYWLTRYLKDTRPELISRILQQPMGTRRLERLICNAFEMAPDEFWHRIDAMVVDHFRAG